MEPNYEEYVSNPNGDVKYQCQGCDYVTDDFPNTCPVCDSSEYKNMFIPRD